MKISKQMTPQQQMQELKGQLKNASKMYEEQFLREMVKAMRGTVDHSSLTKPSLGERIYREQLDEQYVDQWADKGGVGFADMIYRDLVEKYYPFLKGPREKQIRPMAISDHYRGMVKEKIKEEHHASTYQVQLEPQARSTPLKLPWDSVVKESFKLADGRQYVHLQHPQGLQSKLVFRGELSPGPKNLSLGAGEIFAELNANVNSMLWQIEKTNR